jgi:hypothetical protein
MGTRARKEQQEELTARLVDLQRLVEQLIGRVRDQETRIYDLQLPIEQRLAALEQQVERAIEGAHLREQDRISQIDRAVAAHRNELNGLADLLPGDTTGLSA